MSQTYGWLQLGTYENQAQDAFSNYTNAHSVASFYGCCRGARAQHQAVQWYRRSLNTRIVLSLFLVMFFNVASFGPLMRRFLTFVTLQVGHDIVNWQPHQSGRQDFGPRILQKKSFDMARVGVADFRSLQSCSEATVCPAGSLA